MILKSDIFQNFDGNYACILFYGYHLYDDIKILSEINVIIYDNKHQKIDECNTFTDISHEGDKCKALEEKNITFCYVEAISTIVGIEGGDPGVG